jgi:hypothetical protein
MYSENKTLTLRQLIGFAVLTIPQAIRELDGDNLKGKKMIIVNNPDLLDSGFKSFVRCSGKLVDIDVKGNVTFHAAYGSDSTFELGATEILIIFGDVKHPINHVVFGEEKGK